MEPMTLAQMLMRTDMDGYSPDQAYGGRNRDPNYSSGRANETWSPLDFLGVQGLGRIGAGVASMVGRGAPSAAAGAAAPAVSMELDLARRAFINKFGHPPADGIANDAGALTRWTRSQLKSAPANPGVGYDRVGRPFDSTLKARAVREVNRQGPSATMNGAAGGVGAGLLYPDDQQ